MIFYAPGAGWSIPMSVCPATLMTPIEEAYHAGSKG